MYFRIFIFIACCFCVISCKAQKENVDQPVNDEILLDFERWKQSRVKRLTSSSGWLSVTGLIWLKEDELSIGTDDGYDVTIPYHASANFGTLERTENGYQLNPNITAGLKIGNELITEKQLLEHDQSGKTTYIKYESLTWYLIKRGDNLGIRVKDKMNEARLKLESIPCFNYNPNYVFNARVEWATETDSIKITNVQGVTLPTKLMGWLHFNHQGVDHSLAFTSAGKNMWFAVFADGTSNGETYGGGRFLYVPVEAHAEFAVLDFNRAENPPCYFTSFATCPLPVKQNVLTTNIIAGERIED